ncbi:MAG: hypothetical protein IJO56_05805 [Oscillospiraceae bacterium]|nr:hypothetical protein [Oscillospiraceae bacterium]
MPRIIQYAERYAEEDFRREVQTQQGRRGLMSQQSLADASGIPRPTLRKRLLQPDGITVAELRKMVTAVSPDPLVVLTLIGYSKQDIRALTKRLREGSA